MRQTLKLGVITLVSAAVVTGGIALAQNGGSDAPNPTEQAQDYEGRHHGHGRGLARVAEILDMDTPELAAQLSEGASLAEVAAANGSSGPALIDALVADATEKVNAAVADERIDEARGEEILATVQERVTALVNSPDPIGEVRERRQERRENRRERRSERREFVAGVVGLTVEELADAFASGQTLADLGAAAGFSEDELVEALMAPLQERAQAAVDEGKATQAEVDERLAQAEERIRERINTVPDRFGPKHGPGPAGVGPPAVSAGFTL